MGKAWQVLQNIGSICTHAHKLLLLADILLMIELRRKSQTWN